MSKGLTYKKYTDDIPNEDSFKSLDGFIAVSDGAGGCGLFANEWSQYLIDNIDEKKPIKIYKELDSWIDSIWKPFYDEHELIAKEQDGIFQDKFYKEGSCATIAAAWKETDKFVQWMTYGDSVVFHYNRATDKLETSFPHLDDFARPPYLISCKDPLAEEGFKAGEFAICPDSLVFSASDALSHYITLMYMASHPEWEKETRERIFRIPNNDATMLSIADSMKLPFSELVEKLVLTLDSQQDFEIFVKQQCSQGLLDVDDYTLVLM